MVISLMWLGPAVAMVVKGEVIKAERENGEGGLVTKMKSRDSRAGLVKSLGE